MTDMEQKIMDLKEEVEQETGEQLEVKSPEQGTKEEVKAEKSKKSAEKKEKVENPGIKLAQIVDLLQIPGLDTKVARKILRKEVKEGEGKTSWVWETQDEAYKIGVILREAFEKSQVSKEERAQEKAKKSAEKKAEKAAKKKAEKEAEVEDPEDLDLEGEDTEPVKPSKRKSSRKD